MLYVKRAIEQLLVTFHSLPKGTNRRTELTINAFLFGLYYLTGAILNAMLLRDSPNHRTLFCETTEEFYHFEYLVNPCCEEPIKQQF